MSSPRTSVTGSVLFEGLDEPERLALAEELPPRALAAGEILCHAGDPSDSLYVVERGVLRVLDGARGAPLGRQRAGDVLGEVALLTGQPRTATLVAETPSVVREFSKEAFLAAAAAHPALLANLATIASRRLVTRTARPLGRVTALMLPAGGWAESERATAAAVSSSARELRVTDATGSLAQVLEDIYAVPGSPVLVRVPADCPFVSELLSYCDRQVPVADGDDAARVGRRLARAAVGVALGAGGAKGWAHVGVLRALENAGYVVDAVSGSSIGAWIGAWVAMGHDAEGVDRLMREQFDTSTVEVVFRRGGQEGVEMLEQVARATVGDVTFAELEVPLSVVAADLAARRSVIMDEGSVADALVAAMTVPGLHKPARRGDQRLVDAVVLTPVPTEAVAGADVVVAVNCLGARTFPPWPAAASPVPQDRDAVVESLELASAAAAAAQTAAADVPVTPVFGAGTWRDFSAADRYLAAGERAMRFSLPVLRSSALPSRG